MTTDKGTDNDTQGEQEDNPFADETVEQNSSRIELEKKTCKELGKMVFDSGKTPLKLTTLERTSKAELIDILLDIKKVEPKSKARASRNDSESTMMIDTLLHTLESFKKSREEDEQAKLNPVASSLFRANAVSSVDEIRANEEIDSAKMSKYMTIATGLIVVVDGLVGFNNIPALFGKIKSKLKGNSDAN